MKKILQIILLILSLTLFPHAHARSQNTTHRFTVLHINDTHGRFWHNHQGEYGFAAQKTLIDKIRKEVKKQGGSLILLHAGDVNTGVPESDIQYAYPDIEALNMMGYDAMTLGNHEFDNPTVVLKQQEQWAKFPFLSANVLEKNTHRPLVKPYTILHKKGLKIAIVGLTTEETQASANPKHVENLIFENALQSAHMTLSELNQKERPDVKIALTHLGYHPDDVKTHSTSDLDLVKWLPNQSFDIVVGGHSHTLLCMEKGSLKTAYQAGERCTPHQHNGTWILQAGEWGKYLGRADFEWKNGKIKLLNYQLIPINLKHKIKDADGNEKSVFVQAPIAPHPELQSILQAHQSKAEQTLLAPIATVQGVFDGSREVSRWQQSALAHLITQSQVVRLQADLAVINGGAIRGSLPEQAVSYKDVLNILPYSNKIAYVDIKGKDLLDYLQTIALYEKGDGNYPHFSADLSMTILRHEKKIDQVRLNGKKIRQNKTYRLALIDYLATGGDAYPPLNKHPKYVLTNSVDSETLKTYLQQRQTIHAAEFEPKGEISEWSPEIAPASSPATPAQTR